MPSCITDKSNFFSKMNLNKDENHYSICSSQFELNLAYFCLGLGYIALSKMKPSGVQIASVQKIYQCTTVYRA